MIIAVTGALGIRELIPLLIGQFTGKNKAENKLAVMEADRKEDEIRDAQLLKAYDQIKKLQEQVDMERDKWINLSEKTGRLIEQLREAIEARRLAEYEKCTVPDCPLRVPPRKHELNKNATNGDNVK